MTSQIDPNSTILIERFLGSICLVVLGVAVASITLLLAGEGRRPMPTDAYGIPTPNALCYQRRASEVYATGRSGREVYRCYPRAMLPAYGFAVIGGLLTVVGTIGALRAMAIRGQCLGGAPYGAISIVVSLVVGFFSLRLVVYSLTFSFFGSPAPPTDVFLFVGIAGALMAFALLGGSLLSVAGPQVPVREEVAE